MNSNLEYSKWVELFERSLIVAYAMCTELPRAFVGYEVKTASGSSRTQTA
jgi:hypothetical protein